jgi:hypothetical protein
MPVWTPRNVRIDVPLTKQLLGIAPDTARFIAQEIFPVVDVEKRTGMIWKWEQEDLFRLPVETKRAEKTKGSYTEYAVTSDSYTVHDRAMRTEISWEQRAESGGDFGEMLGAAEKVRDTMLLDYEYRVAVSETGISSINNVGSGTTLSGTDQWSDYDNSDPITDINAGIESIESSTGWTPNLMIIPFQVFQRLKFHPLIRNTFLTSNAATAEQIGALFDIEKVLIGRAKANTENKGEASVTYTDVWAKNVIIARVAAGADPTGRIPSLGYTYRQRNKDKNIVPFGVQRWEDPDGQEYTNVRVRLNQTEKLTFTQLGYVIASAVA